MEQKICCGGFYLGEGLELDGRTLKATGGSGLPDPSELPDGTAMVVVNGEWKMQEGYGYTSEPAFEPITWDGDTEGRTSFADMFYKVSDNPISKTDIIGGTYEISDGSTHQINQESISDLGTVYDVDGDMLIALEDSIVEEMSIEQGVYFIYTSDEISTGYITSLTPALSIHKIDSKYLPQSGGTMMVNITIDENSGGYVADKTYNEIMDAINMGIVVKCVIYDEDKGRNVICDLHSYNIVK